MAQDVWPALPLLILGFICDESVENVISGLHLHLHCICQINLDFYTYTSSQIEKLWRAMQVPLPELAGLNLSFRGWPYVLVLPNLFLGGSAPHL